MIGGIMIFYFALDKALIMMANREPIMNSIITEYNVHDENKINLHDPNMVKPMIVVTSAED